uniref:NADH-ubiquinone oxidoreductase chain 2 n=1 Tax=Polyplax asiatica TaxID=1425297 RepID=V9PXL0_9NEOP|nr:NADH dehydrogenase subunit 2 [Polyplax asiatica]
MASKLIMWILISWCSLLALSAATWFQFWVILELSTIFFLPVLSSSSVASKGRLWLYYLIQAIGSGLFLAFSALGSWGAVAELSSQPSSFGANFVVILSLVLKLSAPPFHLWGVQVSESLSWGQFFSLNILMKIPPLAASWKVLGMVELDSLGVWVLFSLLVLSSGLSEESLRRFLTYSSSMNVVWALMASAESDLISSFYFFMYGLSFLGLTQLLKEGSCSMIQDLFLKSLWSLTSFSLMTSVMMTMGLPPLATFWVKVKVLSGLASLSSWLSASLMFLSVLFVLIYFWILIISFLSMKSWAKLHSESLSLSSLSGTILSIFMSVAFAL